MRRFLYILIAFLAAVACAHDIENDIPSGMDPALEGKPVTITFSVPDVCIKANTKSGEGLISGSNYLDADRLYLVVCGHSQSIKYIRKAEMVMDEQTGLPLTTEVPAENIPDYPLAEVSGNVSVYSFTVQLELSDSDRTVHFLGNIDENQLNTGSYSYQLLPTLISAEGQQAYWQKVYMKSIHPKLDSHNNPIVTESGSYLPDADTEASLSYIPLIRNYAKILVTDATAPEDGFELYSYAVVCFPKRGSVVPYRSNVNVSENEDPFSFGVTSPATYRFSGYERCNFLTLDETLGYLGTLPPNVEFDEDIPEAEMFENPELSGGRVIKYDKNNPEKGFYIYERGIPNGTTLDPTYVIIRGRFGETGEFYYYRLDLMETRTVNYESVYQYYPIFRNFRYNIQLNRISSVGVSTPRAAANSSGAEDISADISMRYLPDISNGQTRLVVEPYISKTFTGPNEEGYYYLYARFFNDINSPEPNTDWGAVSVELEPMDDNSDDILILYDDVGNEVHSFYPSAQEWGGEPGFRIIRFNTKVPGSETKTQRIKITGRNLYTHEEYPLYRRVEISLQQKQNLTVTCSTPELPSTKGAKQEVRISIPDGLPASMFPLEFTIEAELPTLTPDNEHTGNNLPVSSGISISDNAQYQGKTTIQFIRTLTWDEYDSISPNDGLRTFSCFFKSNRSRSATTVWVYNDYFNKSSATFTNLAELIGHFYVQAADDEDCYVVFNNGNNLEYNFDETGWQQYKAGTAIHLDRGYKVAFRSTTTITAWNGASKFYCYKSGSSKEAQDGKFSVGGNLASLIMGDNYISEAETFNTSYSFTDFLKGHKNLTDASELVIPMKKCFSNCFKSFFDGCTNLRTAPELPATTLADQCYRNMFLNCSSLEEAPYLPAEKLATKCYQRMFTGCSSLRLIKINSKEYVYGSFQAANEASWVSGVAASGEIWINPAIKGSKNFETILPPGWTVLTLPDGEPFEY